MTAAKETTAPLLVVESLVVRYMPRHTAGAHASVTALDGVSFSVRSGTTLALVGASGSGKSTLALCLACLKRPSAGKILLEGREITALPEAELRAVRPQMQLVFQDPAGSLNPRLSAYEIVCEPFVVQRRFAPAERGDRVRRLFERVGLPFQMAGRSPADFSGGQRQRLAIARALALEPHVLILDEALAALDASMQAQIANLLLDLRLSSGLTCVFITHDLAMAACVKDRIAVLDSGRIVESGVPIEMLRQPEHPATRSLVAAMPKWSGPPQGQTGQ